MKKTISLISFILGIVLLSSFALAGTIVLSPNGQGAYSGWTNIGCSSSSEWQCVDESPANTSDNLYTSSKNIYESFAFQDTSLTNEAINSVTLYFYGQRYSSRRYQFQPLIRTSGMNYLGSVKSLTSSYALHSQAYTTNPATGQAWTIAQVNALEAGMKSYSSSYGGRIAQVYAVVDYSISDSCQDSDWGNVPFVFGNVSGWFNQAFYMNADSCVDSSNILEYFCLGNYKTSQQQSCGTDSYENAYCSGNLVYKDLTDYFCASGACGSSTSPVLQENCDSQDDYLGNNFCYNSSVYRNYRDYSCIAGGCNYSEQAILQETCQYGCANGVCNSQPEMPDLIVSFLNATIFDMPLYTNTTNGTLIQNGTERHVWITTSVKNIGRVTSGSYSYVGVVGFLPTSLQYIPILPPNQEVSRMFDFLCSSQYAVTSIADFDNRIAESNEANNNQQIPVDCTL